MLPTHPVQILWVHSIVHATTVTWVMASNAVTSMNVMLVLVSMHIAITMMVVSAAVAKLDLQSVQAKLIASISTNVLRPTLAAPIPTARILLVLIPAPATMDIVVNFYTFLKQFYFYTNFIFKIII